MIQGFLFGIGFLLSFVLVFGLVIIISKLKGKKARIETWEDYATKMMNAEDYKEYSFVQDLIKYNSVKGMIKVPPGYTLKKDVDLMDNEGRITIKTREWIVKNKTNK